MEGRFFSKKIFIPAAHIFHESKLSFAFVNPKPVLQGHVLVAPKRIEELFGSIYETFDSLKLFKSSVFSKSENIIKNTSKTSDLGMRSAVY